MKSRHVFILCALATAALAGCDGASGVSARTVRVQLASSTSDAAAVPTAAQASTSTPLALTGTNGVLRLTDLRLIVSRIKLEGTERACEGDHEGEMHDECEDFALPPSLVQVPLSDGALTIATNEVDPGTYKKLVLRVKNLDIDDDDDEDDMDDDDDHGNVAALRQALADARAAYPNWPTRASMVAVGTFTPAGEGKTPVEFTTFFRAELKIKMDLQPPLVVDDAGASRTIVVTLRPDAWFMRDNGRVLDLSALDFAVTKRVVEFKPEMLRGFRARHHD